MKKIITILVLAVGLSGFAQQPHSKRAQHFNNQLSAEQHATLKAKQMALHLDLSNAQEKQVYNLILKQENRFKKFRAKRRLIKDGNTKPTAKQRFAFINKGLDVKIKFQRQLKNILSADQYSKWKKGADKRMAFRHKKMGKKPRGGKRDFGPRKDRF